jgi:hypothetical protein
LEVKHKTSVKFRGISVCVAEIPEIPRYSTPVAVFILTTETLESFTPPNQRAALAFEFLSASPITHSLEPLAFTNEFSASRLIAGVATCVPVHAALGSFESLLRWRRR